MLSGEATYTNCIVFGLTRPGLEPSVYCTRDEHAYHYTTDVVQLYWYIKFIVIFIYKHIAVFILFCSLWKNEGSHFSVFYQTDYIICRFEWKFYFFTDQIIHFESQFENMDDLLLAFAYNVKTTHFQPSSNKVLQPRKRWDVLCRIIREC